MQPWQGFISCLASQSPEPVSLGLRRVLCVGIRVQKVSCYKEVSGLGVFLGLPSGNFPRVTAQLRPTQAGFRRYRAPDPHRWVMPSHPPAKLLGVSDWPIQGERFGLYKLSHVTLHLHNYFYHHQFHMKNRKDLNPLFQICMITIFEGNC